MNERLANARTGALSALFLYWLGADLRAGRRIAVWVLTATCLSLIFLGYGEALRGAESLLNDQFGYAIGFYVDVMIRCITAALCVPAITMGFKNWKSLN